MEFKQYHNTLQSFVIARVVTCEKVQMDASTRSSKRMVLHAKCERDNTIFVRSYDLRDLFNAHKNT